MELVSFADPSQSDYSNLYISVGLQLRYHSEEPLKNVWSCSNLQRIVIVLINEFYLKVGTNMKVLFIENSSASKHNSLNCVGFADI